MKTSPNAMMFQAAAKECHRYRWKRPTSAMEKAKATPHQPYQCRCAAVHF